MSWSAKATAGLSLPWPGHGRGVGVSATAQITGLGTYLDAFSRRQQEASDEPAWLRHLREDAFGEFCDAGFPTTRNEDWRFTSLSSLVKENFAPAVRNETPVTSAAIEGRRVDGSLARLVFVNGRFEPRLSDIQGLPQGMRAGSLAEVIASSPELLETHLARYANYRHDSFCALNTALFEDGAYVAVARGAVTPGPLHLLFVATANSSATMVHPRTLLLVGENGELSIVEEHVSLGDGAVLTNSVTEIVAAGGSSVSHHVLECENRNSFHIATLRIQQSRGATVRAHSVLTGGALVRNNVHPVLAGEGAECLINGLFIGGDRQHLDNFMMVEHASPHCASHQFYNGLLGGHAHGVFHGRILVHKDAQKTDAKQTNRNLLLSDDARIDTKPQLEIYADDVKCTHGATIGQIEENSLFYLRSRGLDEASARQMLLLAFAGECLDRIQDEQVREYMERSVDAALLGASRYQGGAK